MTDEILAHISAPATRQTDKLYQTLADAYRDFEPHTSSADPVRPDHAQLRPSGASLKVSLPARDDSSDILATSIVASSKDLFGSFPSHLSSEDHVNSYTQGASQVDGDSTEYGSIPASSRLARLERLHQNWKETTAPRTSFAKSFGSSQRSRQAQDDDAADTAFIEDTQLAMQALLSQLEVSRSTTSNDTSESDADSEELTGIFQVSDVPDDRNDVVANHTDDPSSPAGAAEPSIDILAATRPSLPCKTSVSPALSNYVGNEKMQTLLHPTLAAEVFDFSKLPLDVFPPPPKVSVAQPGDLPSQITRYLASVKKRHPNRYRLIGRKYKPTDDDRGYWAVNCVSWPVKAQLGLWSSLHDFLLKEKLGWGPTIHRLPKSSHEMGEIRLYCWAEVAEHMWLQLWLCSGGYISSLKWYDADGTVVLQAKLRPKGSATGTGSES